MPAIVYQEITAGDRGQSTRGGSGIMRSFVQVTCLADRYDQATDLAEEARIILDGYTGAAGGVTVQHCVLQNGSRRDLPTLAGDSEEQTRFGVQMDFNVMYVADVPNP